jgi:IMP dehydrogenase
VGIIQRLFLTAQLIPVGLLIMLRIDQEALTFDDVLLVPGYSEVLPKDVSLKSRLTKEISINIPLASAAMDTVTESGLAIAMAQEGGIGIIHKNLTPKEQANEVAKVKKYEAGVVSDPITCHSDMTVGEIRKLADSLGFSGFPVVDNGLLVGIVTSRDMRFENYLDAKVSSIMTPKEQLVTVTVEEGVDKEKVRNLLRKHRIEKILVVDDAFALKGMMTVKDMYKAQAFPDATKDSKGQLLVGAAVGTGPETPERVELLVQAGVDVIIVDTAHGHSKGVIDRVSWIKTNFPQVQVIGGNIATAAAAIALADAGADGVKVGIGPGSICTTRIVSGIGVPQISAVANVAEALKDRDVPLIADGGIRFSGDIAKAIVAGASAVMVGSMLAGTDEAPGEVELFQGRAYKSYRGMGSIGAMAQSSGSSDRYFQDAADGAEKLVPEGIEGRVACKGTMKGVVHQLMGGLRASMGYTGSADLNTMRTVPTFVRITSAGMNESHVHDVSITKESPNYRI